MSFNSQSAVNGPVVPQTPVVPLGPAIHRLAQLATLSGNIAGGSLVLRDRILYGNSGLSPAPQEAPFTEVVEKCASNEGMLRALELVTNQLESQLQRIDSTLNDTHQSI